VNAVSLTNQVAPGRNSPAQGRREGSTITPIPALDVLGRDLLVTTRRQCWLSCLRPPLGVGLYVLAALLGWWWLTPVLVFLVFVAVVTVTHDVVHGSLGLSRRQTDWALFFFGALLLESGHAYRITHLQHHRVFPGADDPEGDPARMSFWGAVFFGPLFLPRLWWWAYRRGQGQPAARGWLLLEAGWAALVPVAGVLLLPWTPVVLVYAVLVVTGSWVYPLLTVYLPHHAYGNDPLTQTGSVRGRFLPALFLELTYHLEHHLYPAVPSHHLPELSQRLGPFFEEHGVKPRRVL
jgi:beta-carotene hydroxylase